MGEHVARSLRPTPEQVLVHICGGCYCPAELDWSDPLSNSQQPAPLPLPPLPPAPPGAAWYPPAATPYPWPPYPVGPVYPYPPPNFYYLPLGPRVWTVFVAYVVALALVLLSQFVGDLVLFFVYLARHPDGIRARDAALNALAQEMLGKPKVMLSLLLSIQVVLASVAIGAAYLSPRRFVERLRLGRSTLPWLSFPLVLAGAFSIGLLFEYITRFIPKKEEGPLKMLNDMIRHLTPGQVILAVLVIGVGPAIGEELLCRGYIQTRLSRRWGRWGAISITAALFGLMHMAVVQGAFAALFGVYLGYLAEKTGSIRPGMLCHFFNNACVVVLARYGESWNVGLLVIALAAACLIASVLYLWLGVKPPPSPPEEQPVPQPWPWFPPAFVPPPVRLS